MNEEGRRRRRESFFCFLLPPLPSSSSFFSLNSPAPPPPLAHQPFIWRRHFFVFHPLCVISVFFVFPHISKKKRAKKLQFFFLSLRFFFHPFSLVQASRRGDGCKVNRCFVVVVVIFNLADSNGALCSRSAIERPRSKLSCASWCVFEAKNGERDSNPFRFSNLHFSSAKKLAAAAPGKKTSTPTPPQNPENEERERAVTNIQSNPATLSGTLKNIKSNNKL